MFVFFFYFFFPRRFISIFFILKFENFLPKASMESSMLFLLNVCPAQQILAQSQQQKCEICLKITLKH